MQENVRQYSTASQRALDHLALPLGSLLVTANPCTDLHAGAASPHVPQKHLNSGLRAGKPTPCNSADVAPIGGMLIYTWSRL